jgi:hypothetical protein
VDRAVLPDFDYNWENVPSVDLDNVYCHPILQEEGAAMNAPATTASSTPEQESNVSKHDSDSEVEEEEPEEEGSKKRRKVKKAIPLKCSYQQFVKLLQELLTFHAFYCNAPPPL